MILARARGSSSAKTNPSAAQSVQERSQSEFPSLAEATANLSIAPRAQTSRPTNRRQLYSVVPETAALTPIRRPDPHGTLGRPVEIYTNHFLVSIQDAIVNQYDIDISMIRRDGRETLARKDERWETLQELMKREKNFPLVW